MKYLIPFFLGIALMIGATSAFAVGAFPVATGGTGSTTLYGIILGNGTSPVNSLTIGSGLSLTGTTLSAIASAVGLSTTSPWVSGNLAYVHDNGHVSSVATSTLTTGTGLTGSFTQIGSGGSVSLSVPVSVANGGTGAITLTGCLTGNGTGAITGSGTCNITNATVSSVGLSSSGSTLSISGTNPITSSGTFNAELNLTHANSWSALQNFSNATSTFFTATTEWLPSLGTPAGTFIAVNPSGQLIATSSPVGNNFFTNSGNLTSLSTGNSLAIGTTTNSAVLEVASSTIASLPLFKVNVLIANPGSVSTTTLTFTSNMTWTAPVGLVDAQITCIGGGGGGGGGALSANAGGGGGGSTAFSTLCIADGGGGGGGAGASGASGGGAGGSTGGTGGTGNGAGSGGGGGGGAAQVVGTYMAASLPSSATITIGQGGIGGSIATGGTGLFNGANGNSTSGANFIGGGGGGATGSGSGSTGGTGASTGGTITNGTAGTSSNGGAGGASGSGASGGAAGTNGSLYGAGGGGSSTSATAGGSGAQGEVIVAEAIAVVASYPVMTIDQYGHLITGGPTPVANSCTGFAIMGSANDRAGTINLTSGTSCSFNWANVYASNQTVECSISPGSAASTYLASTTQTGIAITFGTAQTRFSYQCMASQ